MINKTLLKASAAAYGVNLNDTALDRFDKYAEELVAWNEKINLTAITEPDEIVMKHFVDSLVVLSKVDLPKGASLLDIGTGAGFPGLALKIARPDLNVTLLDSTEKKLKVAQELPLGLEISEAARRAEVAGGAVRIDENEKRVVVAVRADIDEVEEVPGGFPLRPETVLRAREEGDLLRFKGLA